MSSEFFSNYPRIAYDISGNNSTVPDYTVAVNLLIRSKLRDAIEDDVTVYYPYSRSLLGVAAQLQRF